MRWEGEGDYAPSEIFKCLTHGDAKQSRVHHLRKRKGNFSETTVMFLKSLGSVSEKEGGLTAAAWIGPLKASTVAEVAASTLIVKDGGV